MIFWGIASRARRDQWKRTMVVLDFATRGLIRDWDPKMRIVWLSKLLPSLFVDGNSNLVAQ